MDTANAANIQFQAELNTAHAATNTVKGQLDDAVRAKGDLQRDLEKKIAIAETALVQMRKEKEAETQKLDKALAALRIVGPLIDADVPDEWEKEIDASIATLNTAVEQRVRRKCEIDVRTASERYTTLSTQWDEVVNNLSEGGAGAKAVRTSEALQALIDTKVKTEVDATVQRKADAKKRVGRGGDMKQRIWCTGLLCMAVLNGLNMRDSAVKKVVKAIDTNALVTFKGKNSIYGIALGGNTGTPATIQFYVSGSSTERAPIGTEGMLEIALKKTLSKAVDYQQVGSFAALVKKTTTSTQSLGQILRDQWPKNTRGEYLTFSKINGAVTSQATRGKPYRKLQKDLAVAIREVEGTFHFPEGAKPEEKDAQLIAEVQDLVTLAKAVKTTMPTNLKMEGGGAYTQTLLEELRKTQEVAEMVAPLLQKAPEGETQTVQEAMQQLKQEVEIAKEFVPLLLEKQIKLTDSEAVKEAMQQLKQEVEIAKEFVPLLLEKHINLADSKAVKEEAAVLMNCGPQLEKAKQELAAQMGRLVEEGGETPDLNTFMTETLPSLVERAHTCTQANKKLKAAKKAAVDKIRGLQGQLDFEVQRAQDLQGQLDSKVQRARDLQEARDEGARKAKALQDKLDAVTLTKVAADQIAGDRDRATAQIAQLKAEILYTRTRLTNCETQYKQRNLLLQQLEPKNKDLNTKLIATAAETAALEKSLQKKEAKLADLSKHIGSCSATLKLWTEAAAAQLPKFAATEMWKIPQTSKSVHVAQMLEKNPVQTISVAMKLLTECRGKQGKLKAKIKSLESGAQDVALVKKELKAWEKWAADLGMAFKPVVDAVIPEKATVMVKVKDGTTRQVPARQYYMNQKIGLMENVFAPLSTKWAKLRTTVLATVGTLFDSRSEADQKARAYYEANPVEYLQRVTNPTIVALANSVKGNVYSKAVVKVGEQERSAPYFYRRNPALYVARYVDPVLVSVAHATTSYFKGDAFATNHYMKEPVKFANELVGGLLATFKADVVGEAKLMPAEISKMTGPQYYLRNPKEYLTGLVKLRVAVRNSVPSFVGTATITMKDKSKVLLKDYYLAWGRLLDYANNLAAMLGKRCEADVATWKAEAEKYRTETERTIAQLTKAQTTHGQETTLWLSELNRLKGLIPETGGQTPQQYIDRLVKDVTDGKTAISGMRAVLPSVHDVTFDKALPTYHAIIMLTKSLWKVLFPKPVISVADYAAKINAVIAGTVKLAGNIYTKIEHVRAHPQWYTPEQKQKMKAIMENRYADVFVDMRPLITYIKTPSRLAVQPLPPVQFTPASWLQVCKYLATQNISQASAPMPWVPTAPLIQWITLLDGINRGRIFEPLGCCVTLKQVLEQLKARMGLNFPPKMQDMLNAMN